MAPTGHILISGHTWLCGHIFLLTCHDTVFVCKIKHYSLFYEIDFLYLSIEIIEYKQSYMTLQQMEYIVAVDKYRHFAKAAESCGVSQSTLSSLVQKLETELDVTIFDRNSHPVKPTAVGEEIISRVKRVLFNAAQVKELVATRKESPLEISRLGLFQRLRHISYPRCLNICRSTILTYICMSRKRGFLPSAQNWSEGRLISRLWRHLSTTANCWKSRFFRNGSWLMSPLNRLSTMTLFCRQTSFL